MEALKPGIEVRRGAKIAVSQHPAGELVVLRLAHDQCRRGMAVLVRRHSDADRILNGSRDLVAKGLETPCGGRSRPERARPRSSRVAAPAGDRAGTPRSA